MDIIICGGGEIGSEAAEVLARRGDNVTVIDTDAKRLEFMEEHLDIRTLNGVASSQTLRAAGAANADAVIAVTGIDEVNLDLRNRGGLLKRGANTREGGPLTLSR